MDFGSISKGNMKRKQSSSLLAALGKPSQRPPGQYQAPPSSYQQSYSPSLASSDESHENFSSAGSIYHGHPGTQRSLSNSTSTSTSQMSSMYGRERANITPRSIRRVDDVYLLVKERVAQWSYLMQWYNGDAPWLNSVHVARSTLESALGAKALDTRARQEYALGLSLAALFDISGAPDFLRGAYKLMDEWEAWTESDESTRVLSRPIRNFFRPTRVKTRPTIATNTATAEVTIAPVDATSESFLVLAVMPFTPDFFQVHASTCSIMRDVYKKLLAMILPSTRGGGRADLAAGTLLHPSTLLLLGPVDGSGAPVDVASDANLLGDMPNGLTLVGEGQKLSNAVIDLLLKVDARLKKHYAFLVRDGDVLARNVLDAEFAALSASMSGGPALSFNQPAMNTWAETTVV